MELRLPSASNKVQASNRMAWNGARSMEAADFFTVGYAGRTGEQFVQTLVEAGIRTLVDIRHAPVSMYKPEFSKRNLERLLAEHKIDYLHLPDLGVPRDIRSKASNQPTRDAIWAWYEEFVLPRFTAKNLHWFFNWAEHPVALMCVEVDPTACHRHLLARGLERHGLAFYDL
jgi:uncharacterized protein (DUF488 family)